MRSLASSKIVPRLVSERPEPEWRLGALTGVGGKQRARLRYAREPVGSARSEAQAIAVAWQRVLAKLQARSLPPDELLPRLQRAYAAVLASHAKRANDRAPLVEIREQLEGYTRAQFAWDL